MGGKMTTIILKESPNENFTILQNDVIRDSRLSFRARGILIRLLSNKTGFRTTAEDLVREGKEGYGAVLTALRELRKIGYVWDERLKNENGQWAGRNTYVAATPKQPKQANQITEIQKKKPKKEEKLDEFGEFNCEFKNGIFEIGKDKLVQFKERFPAVAEEKIKYNGVEGFLKQAALGYEISGRRNQVQRGNWTLSRWIVWKLNEEQDFLSDVAAFGLEFALKLREKK
jgi:hypothetical protein